MEKSWHHGDLLDFMASIGSYRRLGFSGIRLGLMGSEKNAVRCCFLLYAWKLWGKRVKLGLKMFKVCLKYVLTGQTSSLLDAALLGAGVPGNHQPGVSFGLF